VAGSVISAICVSGLKSNLNAEARPLDQPAWLGVVLIEVSGDDLRCPALSTKKNSMVLPRHIHVVDSQCRPVETGCQLGHGDREDDLIDLDSAE
jgi:hypothetical protein